MKNKIFVLVVVPLLFACVKETIDSETKLGGTYAYDDGTGFSDQYIRFEEGYFSEVSFTKKLSFMENAFWEYEESLETIKVQGKYSLKDGLLTVSGEPMGAIETKGGILYYNGKKYSKVKQFCEEHYSSIVVNNGAPLPSLDYHYHQIDLPINIKNPIPDSQLTVSSSASWCHADIIGVSEAFLVISKNFISSPRTATLTLSYNGAADVRFTIRQDGMPSLDSDGSANCYIVNQPGSYQFSTVMGNSSTSVGKVSKAEVLWESFGTSTAPSKGDIILSVSCTSNKITFSTPSSLKNGNAVIAAKDASGNILWSWHIWVCGGYIETDAQWYHGSYLMMDRNLGATSATPGDVGAIGLLYQWGRKDPFLARGGITEQTQAKSTITWPSGVESNPSRGTIDYSIKNPTTYITQNSNNHDWYYTGDSTTDKLRWAEGSKTIYDPCPPGWQVPNGGPYGVWSWPPGTGSSSFSYPWNSTNIGMNFSGKFGISMTNMIWYPASGYLSSTGAFKSAYQAQYWSATSDDSSYNAFYLKFNESGMVYPSQDGWKVCGQSVRCKSER